jgi:hypothetical protein
MLVCSNIAVCSRFGLDLDYIAQRYLGNAHADNLRDPRWELGSRPRLKYSSLVTNVYQGDISCEENLHQVK